MATMYCPKCSIENDSDSIFCKRCGYRFIGESGNAGSQIPVSMNSATQGSYHQGQTERTTGNISQGQADRLPNYGTNYHGTQKKKKNVPAFAIIIVVLILWGYASGNRDSRSSTRSESMSQSNTSTSQDSKVQTEDTTQELVDEWKRQGEELANSFREQVNVDEIQEQVKEQIENSVKEQLGEMISSSESEKNGDTEAEEKKEEHTEGILEGVVTPSFKETMDSYESFFDEYIVFMNKMMNGNAMTSMDYLNDYAAFMAKYEEAMEALDKMDTDKMSPADQAYYFEVMARIEAKLLKVAGAY